ncbi:hypothetical protein ACQPX6_25785 [Actinomycetospora sp. CA-101289]|uniref:hypothetical protein n=1 Tax=Actinomycetospora sp. CA-101289 TaxID=3239893 RepID=UPI003D98B63F
MVGAEVAALVAGTVPAMRRRGRYRPPGGQEVGDLAELADALARGDAEDAVRVGGRLGLASDTVGGALVLRSDPDTERAWLVAVLRPGVVPGVVVEVPHPNADLDTEAVGLGVWRRCPGALYLQAGAHRAAGASPDACERGDFPADVAARADTPFARVAAGLVARGLPQLQLHGFADREGVDVVLSPGASAGGPLLAAVAERLAATGERVGVGEDPRWTDLLGRRNVQGLAAAERATAFVHLELSRSLRRDAGRREAVADALARAVDDLEASGGISWR